jgi:hypothetical protein
MMELGEGARRREKGEGEKRYEVWKPQGYKALSVSRYSSVILGVMVLSGIAEG